MLRNRSNNNEMDELMLPSPSFSMPSLGTPHPMEEDQMINPSGMYRYYDFCKKTSS